MISEFNYSLIKSCLKELSDLEYQQRVWLRGEGPEISSFTEVVCRLYDDTGIGDQLDENSDGVLFSKDIDPLFKKLTTMIDAIDEGIPAADIFNHPNWSKIRQLSLKVLNLIEDGQVGCI